MAWEILEHREFKRISLRVVPEGVKLVSTMGLTRGKIVPWHEIDCVLKSDRDVISIHYGREVFRIKYLPRKRVHREVLEAMLSYLRSPESWHGVS